MRKKWDADMVILEASHGGMALESMLKKGGYKPWLRTMPAKVSKEERAETQTVKFQQGRIWLPRDAEWRPSFEEQLAAFPKGKHDDQVDALVQFLRATDVTHFSEQIKHARQG